MERIKKEIRKTLLHLTGLNLNDKNLMKVINCWVVTVAGYIMNVCNLAKGDLEELEMTVKNRENDFMEDNQAMRDYIRKETKVADDWKVSKRFTMKQKLEWHAAWLQQQANR